MKKLSETHYIVDCYGTNIFVDLNRAIILSTTARLVVNFLHGSQGAAREEALKKYENVKWAIRVPEVSANSQPIYATYYTEEEF